ncbi:NTE family protein [Geodermatophilus obscurus]|uniref:NTE family protein n=1 Tax=Geodermatophilus obscurus TaxID=1861 RepID=A0A1I5CNC3_9ACTN|nr:patatin-like phospholipase family protein [Geodermatophilus obscurus]SFN88382.1 NTE family protein [Geodermatophilus obscurus]
MSAGEPGAPGGERDREAEAGSPVSSSASEPEPEAPGRPEEDPGEGTALCLSGGGYRAMLFHVGALWRLNELGRLPRLTRVSSVSGGSITAAVLALGWDRLRFREGVALGFGDVVVRPVRDLAGHTIDVPSVLGGILSPSTVSERVAGTLRRRLYPGATLQDLPEEPRFVINATNLQSGSLWRFSRPYMADHRVGMVRAPAVDLATAVAASAAFPPLLSPVRLTVDPDAFEPRSAGPLATRAFTSEIVLSDGGVYDNLALETAWKRASTILVSDGGGQLEPQARIPSDWPRHALRVNGVIDHQVRNLRKRQLVAAFRRGDRTGTYWGIRTPIDRYLPLDGALPCPPEQTALLAAVPTRLKRLPSSVQEQLVNWGYAVCDAAVRRHLDPTAAAPAGFPYPGVGVG